MSDKQPSQRFLRETCSQHLHREENMRRRQELLRRENTKPPVMHFGPTSTGRRGGSKSVSPPPRIAPQPEKTTSPALAGSGSRSRPQSRERSRRLPRPPGGKPAGESSRPRSRSYRVVSPLPGKRTRSTSQTGPRAKLTRFSLPRANEGKAEELRAPFMCSGSPSKRGASHRKRSVSKTPPPTPTPQPAPSAPAFFPVLKEKDVVNDTSRVQKAEETKLHVSPFALPCTTSSTNEEAKRIPLEPCEEEEEEAITFRVSEFRMPRTPQHRSIEATSPSASKNSHNKEEGQEENAKGNKEEVKNDESTVVDALDQSSLSDVVSALSVTGEVCVSHQSAETVLPFTNSLNTAVEPHEKVNDHHDDLKGEEEEEEKGKENQNEEMRETMDVVANEEKENEEARKQKTECVSVDVGSSTNEENVDIPLPSHVDFVVLEKTMTVEQETVVLSAYSSHAYECSSTTTETPYKPIEESESRKLTFDWCDASQNEERDKISLETLKAEEYVATTCQLQKETDGGSQPFYECISAPTTPGLQLPEAYRLLEATRQEMAVGPTFQQRAPRRMGERRNEEGRGSLLLVTGELPAVYTPSIQEPHTPPPSLPSEKFRRQSPLPGPGVKVSESRVASTPPPKDKTSLLSLDLSPMPRPVTLRSQVPTPVLTPRAKLSVSFLQSPSKNEKQTSFRTPQTTMDCKQNEEEAAEEKLFSENQCTSDECVAESTPPNLSSRGRSRSTCSRKSIVVQLIECCSPEARKEVEQFITADADPQTPSLNRGSGQISEVLTDTSTISQRVAARHRKHYYDYTYWERYLRDMTRKSAKKERKKDAKKANKTMKRTRTTQNAKVESTNQVEKKTVAEKKLALPSDAEFISPPKAPLRRAQGNVTQTSKTQRSVPPSDFHTTQKKNNKSKKSSIRVSRRTVMSRKNREQLMRRMRCRSRNQKGRK